MPEKKKPKAKTKTAARLAEPMSVENARRGDRIVIDSAQVGSPAREGEILRVMAGELSVSYRVRWADGHESVISPGAGVARIIRLEPTR
jgi:hypothetical protein